MPEIMTPERFTGQLYAALPDDYAPEARDFTVTVAGTERHDGEAPYTYVVTEHSTEKAWAKVLAHHMVEQEDIDVTVVAPESFTGVPSGVTYHWVDLRPEPDAQSLADKANRLIERADEENTEGYDQARSSEGDWAADVVDFLREVASD